MSKCFGIDHSDTKLYVSIPHIQKIQILDHGNPMVNTNLSSVKSAFYLRIVDDKLFCSNHVENIIFCLSTSGSILWEFKNELLKEPFCLTPGTNENIFVTCRKQKIVLAVSFDCATWEAITLHVPNVKPRAIDYCVSNNKLLVCDERSGLSVVFKLKQRG